MNSRLCWTLSRSRRWRCSRVTAVPAGGDRATASGPTSVPGRRRLAAVASLAAPYSATAAGPVLSLARCGAPRPTARGAAVDLNLCRTGQRPGCPACLGVIRADRRMGGAVDLRSRWAAGWRCCVVRVLGDADSRPDAPWRRGCRGGSSPPLPTAMLSAVARRNGSGVWSGPPRSSAGRRLWLPGLACYSRHGAILRARRTSPPCLRSGDVAGRRSGRGRPSGRRGACRAAPAAGGRVPLPIRWPDANQLMRVTASRLSGQLSGLLGTPCTRPHGRGSPTLLGDAASANQPGARPSCPRRPAARGCSAGACEDLLPPRALGPPAGRARRPRADRLAPRRCHPEVDPDPSCSRPCATICRAAVNRLLVVADVHVGRRREPSTYCATPSVTRVQAPAVAAYDLRDDALAGPPALRGVLCALGSTAASRLSCADFLCTSYGVSAAEGRP